VRSIARRRAGIATLAVLFAPSLALAAPAQSTSADDVWGRPFALVVALALVSLLPFVFMSITAFAKIATVLQIAKSAIGAQGIPSSAVIVALASALTLVAMAPVTQEIVDRAAPLLAAKETPEAAELVRRGIDAVRPPLEAFLAKNANAKERTRFFQLARDARPEGRERESVAATNLAVLVPAFLVTELSEAFSVGFLIFLPFLVIDLVVANVLLALGMQMLSPTQISLPFKLLLFVAIDGWGLLAQALVTGYR
jgi:type III secretion protein R